MSPGEPMSDHDQHGPGTLVARLLQSAPVVALVSVAPVPLSVVRTLLQRDNARENARDSWQRLRDQQEAARYAAVRRMTERYAADGFVLDVGCSQGILQEGLNYRRYVGVDSFAESIRIASVKNDERTTFVLDDGATYVADEPPDAVVLNEVIYYLADPIAAVMHHAGQVGPGGVVIISVFSRSWATRRLLRQLAARLTPVDSLLVTSGHLAWTVVAYRPKDAEAAH
jgi:2-polyprenyl-3-methyl-5-hydroxy-6-metoxy-1,4-benzoquinol methylase